MMYAVWMILGYVSGSIMYAYLLPRLLKGMDIRQLAPDGNPGTANAFRYAGVWIGMIVVLCELAKGFFPVFLAARHIDNTGMGFLPVMAAPVLGHACPLGHKAKGGKAIAVSFGVMLGLFPEIRPLGLLILFYLLFSLVIVIRPHFYRTVITFFLYSIGSLFLLENRAVEWGCVLISVIVVWKHFEMYQGERVSVKVGGFDL